MKATLFTMFVFSFSLWGAEPKLVNIDKLQKRGEHGNQLYYLSNQDVPFTGKTVAKWPNGQKQKEANYKDGKIDGLLTYWFKNGQKQGELNYKDGKYHGLWTSWYENGQKETEGNWKDGKLMSMEVWKTNGEKCPVTNVKDGNGGLVLYNEDGTEKVRMTYKDGKVVD